jgi:predicted nucleic-acid-binding Zn-ribbon protein
MICPKCGSENVRIDIITDVRTSHGGCLSWFFIAVLTVLTCGLFLFVALLINWSVKSKRSKVGICQNCGYVIKFHDDAISLTKKWWVWVIAVFIFMLIIGGLPDPKQESPKNESIAVTGETVSQEVNTKELDGKSSKDDFQELKEKGIKAITEDRLSEGIDLVLQALKQQNDLELLKILDEAYYERAEYYYSVENYKLALEDIQKIKNKDPQTKILQIRVLASSVKPSLSNPVNGAKINSKDHTLRWHNCAEADYYQIQIEDKNWDTVIFTTTETTSFTLTQYFEDLSVYYWHVRAHYPDYGYGLWSDKIWFTIETPEGKTKLENERIKGLIRVKNVYTSNPNSAGGVDLHIIWQNLSPKVIKYISFTVVPYNAVNDIVQCTIRDESTFTGQVTGPVYSGEWRGESTYWECPWYNNTIRRAELIGVSITYMDGSKENINKGQVSLVQY